jgi:glutathione peroxidase
MNLLFAVLGLAALTVGIAANDAAAEPKSPLDFTVKNIDGKNVSLKKYKGNVVLIVNTASKCGLTPQYKGLEALYQKYKGQGLKIIAFPANNFLGQEPGTNAEIKQFCSLNYKVSFDLFSKISVKGEDQHPLYHYLTTLPQYGGDIDWNFAKFLVNRKGEVVGRFKAPTDPLAPDVTAAIEAALAEK